MAVLVLAALLLAVGPAPVAVTAQTSPVQESRAGDVAPAEDYEAALTTLLERVVTADGLVRYDLLRGALNLDFRRVLKAIEEFDATALQTPAHKLAFWMNAYNVQMLQNIVETPEVHHIIDDGYAEAFFDTRFRTAGAAMTLNEIENVILRRQEGRTGLRPFQVDRLDPRLHVGLNCAAVSCPRLRRRAFTAANVEAELDAAMRDFAGSPIHFRVEDGRPILSALLDWYGADFDRPGLPAGDFILRFMPATRPGYAALKGYLAGKTSEALKTLPNVQFEYRWIVNRSR